MLWICGALLHFNLLVVSPPLVRLAIAPSPRRAATTSPETGVVIVTGRVEADGGMDNLQRSQGPAIFIQPTMDSIRRWQFERAAIGNVSIPATAVFMYRAETELPN